MRRIRRSGSRTSGVQFLRDLGYDDLADEVEQTAEAPGGADRCVCELHGREATGVNDANKPLTCPDCGGERWIETATLVQTSVGRFVLRERDSLQVEEERPIQGVRTVGLVFHCMACGCQVAPADLGLADLRDAPER